MDADCFIVHLKIDDTYINFAKDVETRFETRFSINELGRTWPRRKTIKGNWINEEWNKYKNNQKAWCIQIKNIQLFNKRWFKLRLD